MRFDGTMRRGLTGTATAVAAMAALTASQAPGLTGGTPADDMKNVASDEVVWTEVPNDDSYHTELPPLRSPEPPVTTGKKPAPAAVVQSWAEAGIPATVLAAYRDAQRALGRTDPGCHLPWQLLAAIGKVESGHASRRPGRRRRHHAHPDPGTRPRTAAGFAHIPDTDNGVYDGDTRYDRAVGPMQFIPSTWAHWGKDGNGDGRADPGNIGDSALAAGHYLCAGAPRPVRTGRPRPGGPQLQPLGHLPAHGPVLAGVLPQGRPPVADGKGVIPRSPGAGSPHAPKAPVGGPGSPSAPGKGGGIVVGPQPSATPSPSASPKPTPTDSGSPAPAGPRPHGPDPRPRADGQRLARPHDHARPHHHTGPGPRHHGSDHDTHSGPHHRTPLPHTPGGRRPHHPRGDPGRRTLRHPHRMTDQRPSKHLGQVVAAPAPPAARRCSSPGSRSGRHRRNCVVWRNRSPSMWS